MKFLSANLRKWKNKRKKPTYYVGSFVYFLPPRRDSNLRSVTIFLRTMS